MVDMLSLAAMAECAVVIIIKESLNSKVLERRALKCKGVCMLSVLMWRRESGWTDG